MTHEERISHLANLTFLLDFHEKLGGPRNKWVLAEFNHHNNELIEELKGLYDETGKRKQQPQRDEGRTDFSSGIPRGGEPTWRDRGRIESGTAPLPRSRLESSNGE